MLKNAIPVKGILESNIFNMTFDFDGWPGNHMNKEEYLRPYNESLFLLRYHYKTVFPESEFDSEIKIGGEIDMGKVYKIKYQVNLLPQIGEYIKQDEKGNSKTMNEGKSFMTLCKETSELNIF